MLLGLRPLYLWFLCCFQPFLLYDITYQSMVFGLLVPCRP